MGKMVVWSLNRTFWIVALFSCVVSCAGHPAYMTVLTYEEARLPALMDENTYYGAFDDNHGKEVMEALSRSYPRFVSTLEYRTTEGGEGDWMVTMRGKLFYYAGGRLLPRELLGKQNDYSPQPFYRYPAQLPEWKEPPENEAESLEKQTDERIAGSDTARSHYFYDTLWNIHNEEEAYIQQKTILFFGKKVMVHHGVMEALAMVEQKIYQCAKTDADVAAWVESIGEEWGWSWRNIADVHTRSNHAYGVAIDIILENLKEETYWFKTRETRVDWWNVPYAERYHPPDAVIAAFESYGFIWGGKWDFFDTMHFEYRPEILILNNIPITGEF